MFVKSTGFFIGKDVNVDLYHLHEATKKKIESLQSNYITQYEEHKEIYEILLSSSIPYGITREQQIMEEFGMIVKQKEIKNKSKKKEEEKVNSDEELVKSQSEVDEDENKNINNF